MTWWFMKKARGRRGRPMPRLRGAPPREEYLRAHQHAVRHAVWVCAPYGWTQPLGQFVSWLSQTTFRSGRRHL
jgi:hypothetical protein